jgi:hypothetical protein
MRRKLLDTAAVVSLLLCAAVLALWARSYFVAVEVSVCEGDFRAGNPWTIGLGSDRGMLWARRYRVFGDGPPARVFARRTPRAEFAGDPPAVGIAAEDAPVDRGRSPKAKGHRWHVYLPHWSVALALIPLPLWRGNRYRMHRARAVGGRCPSCGYDLRASPTRCPECGAAAPVSTAAT